MVAAVWIAVLLPVGDAVASALLWAMLAGLAVMAMSGWATQFRA